MDFDIRRHHIPVVREAEGNMVSALIMIHILCISEPPLGRGATAPWVSTHGLRHPS